MFKRLIIAATLVIVLFFAWFFVFTRPVTSIKTSPLEFEIKSGWSIDRIGQELSSAKLIRSRSAFKISVVVMGLQNHIQAGFFKISPNMSLTDIAQNLTRASTRQIRITLPEGLRRQEIAKILEKAFQTQEDKTFSVTEFLTLTEKKEGYLFPDTYDFSPNTNASGVLAKLESRFQEVIQELAISESDLSQVVILASLLEREAADSTEMPKIAGVITNRLDSQWPLQIDATVQFALSTLRCKKIDCDWWPKSLTKSDLQVASPYNTYLHQGLPPKPISNPGKSALQAAASPEKTSAWFYLHDNQGKIHFATTLEEHNQNVCTYLQKDCPR